MSFLRTYRVAAGERIDAAFAMAHIHNLRYHLTPISIYQNGMVDCWGLVSFEEFKEKVSSGWVVTQPPEGADVSVSFLASFKAVDANYWIEPEELIEEVGDEIEALNGRPTTTDLCLQAWERYEQDSTEANKGALRVAYEAVPEHNRRYVLREMDSKDWPIRRVIYGDGADGEAGDL
ncbi:MAG: DUF7638 domain-containing protein [Actinomycetota bacterium]